MNDAWTVWVGAVVTLVVLSYLVKDTSVYRVVQRITMGVGVGVAIVVTWNQILQPYWWTPVSGAFHGTQPWTSGLWVLALIPGSLWYFQMSRRWFWLSSIVVGLFVGVAAGIAFKSQILLMLPQLTTSIKPLNAAGGLWTLVGNLVFMTGLLTTLLFFCFTLKTGTRFMLVPMRTGRIFVMLALGAMFGNTVMTRMAFLIERVQFLYQVWIEPLFRS